MTSLSLLICTSLWAAGPAMCPLDFVDGLRNSVAPCGDLDGDGLADFAVALRTDACECMTDEPTGGARGDRLNRVLFLSAVDGRLLARVEAPVADRRFGRALEAMLDSDGDGRAEVLVSDSSRIWLVAPGAEPELRELSPELRGEGFGRHLACAGDVNGDGVADVIAFRPACEPLPQELVLVLDGTSGAVLVAFGFSADSPVEGWADEERYVRLPGTKFLGAVGGTRDRDGDGRAELVLTYETRLICQVSGDDSNGPGPSLEVRSSDGRRVLLRVGIPQPGAGLPWLVRDAGDLDGDEVPDLLLASIDDEVAAYSGATGSLLHSRDYRWGYLYAEGSSLEVLGDVDGDRVADYLIAANETGMDCDPGFVEVCSGASGERLTVLRQDYSLADGACGVGVDACAIGDVNGDGLPDIVTHLPRLRQVRILSGSDLGELRRIDLGPQSPLVAGPRVPGGK